MKGEGNQQDYGMRIYDPRLGRFLSVDPLTKKYPWYTPYQFAGNMPIMATDLDGAEPNPVNTSVVNEIYSGSGGDKSYEENKSKITGVQISPTQSLFEGNPINGVKRQFVNTSTAILVDDKPISGHEFTNIMLGNFIKGEGAENYLFPMNGHVSNQLKDAEITKGIMKEWYEKNESNLAFDKPLEGYTNVGKYGTLNSAKAIFTDPLTVKDFVGSARVAIKPINADEVEVTIFNITSLHSADLGKEGWGGTYDYKSVVRDPSGKETRPYSNISQTFKFTLPVKEYRDKAKMAFSDFHLTNEPN